MAQVRVSVANLAWWVQEQYCEPTAFAILNPKKLAAGIKQYQALGGAAQLTARGVQHLIRTFGAEQLEMDDHTGRIDARFIIDDIRLDEVFAWFMLNGKNTPFEYAQTDDIFAELTGKEPRHRPILLPESLHAVDISYVRTVMQRPSKSGPGTSVRAGKAGVPTRRIFRLYTIVVPDYLYQEFKRAPNVKLLTDEERSTTEGGSQAGKTAEGDIIADNIFLV